MEGSTDKEMSETLLPQSDLISIFKRLFDPASICGGESNDLFKQVFTTEDVAKKLNVNPDMGLNVKDSADIAMRKNRFGTNASIENEEIPFMDFVCECFEDKTLQILLAASFVSLVIGILQSGWRTGWIEGVAIFMAVFIVVAITAVNNWSKDRQFNKLNKESKKKFVWVRRDGVKQEINAEELLVGDILYLHIGDILNVDGVLLEGKLSMDESAVTGESDYIKKTPKITKKDKGFTTPFLISGTKTQEGEGLIIVCAVGENTVAGQSKKILLAKEGEDDANKTPLEKQLEILAGRIGDLGFFMAMLIGVLMIIKEVLLRWAYGENIFTITILDTVVNAFIIAVVVIVVAIPEGLPMAVTISLAFSVFKMKEENNLVRHLEASETMGNCNNVCTDKTGTLTEGVMSINNVYTMDKNYPALDSKLMPENGRALLGEVLSSNMTASTYMEDGKVKAKGNMTEVALLQYLIDAGIKYDLKSNDTPILRLPFSSEYKFMITVWEKPDKSLRLYVKGAPERIFSKCSHYIANGGIYKSINNDVKAAFDRQQEDYANQSQRTLIVGFKDISLREIEDAAVRHPEKDLDYYLEILKDIQLVALLGIADAPRLDVPQAIINCISAGVTVRMVTGDNIKTAVAIARKVHILNDREATEALTYIKLKEQHGGKKDGVFGDVGHSSMSFKNPIALEGTEFRELSGGYDPVETIKDGKKVVTYKLRDEDKFKETVKNLKVIARASPDDKFLLVMGLKRIEDNIVAVTGDGTNDAPALKQSHVGFAMGRRGTDIAKDASDIILLNDSFSSVVTAIKYGRNVYDCIRKFIQFQLTTNVVAVFMTLIGGIVLEDSPLNAIQMLWVNLIMDSFASLALATEPPSDKLLQRAPYKKSDGSILTSMMTVNIVTQSVFQIVVLTVIIFYGDIMFNVPSDRELDHYEWNDVNGYHFTIFFNIFVFMQVFNSINARKLLKSEWNVFEGILNNWLYLAVQGFIVVMQIIMVTYGGRALRTHALSFNQHMACILIASCCLVISLIVKMIPFDVDEEKSRRDGTKVSVGMLSRVKSKTRSLTRALPTKSSNM
jgi:P-type Ca2+ transporter type 2B